MQYVGARMHAKWHGVCGLCWGWAAELATSAEFRQVKNYRLTFRLAKSEVGSRTVCSVSCVNGPAPPPDHGVCKRVVVVGGAGDVTLLCFMLSMAYA